MGLTGLCATAQAAMTKTDGSSTITLSNLTTDINGGGYKFDAETGLLTGYNASKGIYITFSDKTWTDKELLVYTSADQTNTDGVVEVIPSGSSTGLLGSGTNGALKGVWGGHKNNGYSWNSGSNTEISSSKITDTIKVVMSKADGVRVFDSAGTEIKHYDGLQSSSATFTNTYINTAHISSIKLVTEVFSANGWSKTYANGAYYITEKNSECKFTTNSAVNADAEKDILVTGEGLLFIHTKENDNNKGSITLENDIYVAGGYNGGYGDIHFGNNAGSDSKTTMKGNLYVVDSAVVSSRGTDTVEFTGTVTDKNVPGDTPSAGGTTLTLQGQGYLFSGTVDVSNLSFAAYSKDATKTAQATFTKGFTAKSVTLAAGSDITSGVAISSLSALTVSGDATFDADLDLSSKVTLTLDGILNLDGSALTLGNSITLGGALISDIDSKLESGALITLFTGVDSLLLGNTAYVDAVDASTVFTGMAAGSYNLVFGNGNVSLTTIPEPTTATLSLLALAGLAARRRRK